MDKQPQRPGQAYLDLRQGFDELRLLHARRQKKPLRFVQAYSAFKSELARFKTQGIAPDKATIPWMMRFMKKTEPDFRNCQG